MSTSPRQPDHRVGVLVFPGVTLLDVAGPTEAFAEANRYGARYSTVLLSADGGPVRSSTGLLFDADQAVAAAGTLDTLLVPGADALAAGPADPVLTDAVRQLAGRAGRVASVCTGAFLLAAAGLLDGRRATTHWRHAAALRRRYPRVRVEPDAIFVTDGPVVTSAGITAGIDLTLAIIERDRGAALAREVARSLVVFMQRPGGQSQFSVAARTPRPDSDLLRQVIDSIAADPAGSHTVPELAAAAGTSTRQLGRLFRGQLGTTPARYVEQVRLEHARMLLDSGYSVTSAARHSGFGSDENLRRAFKQHMGIPPTTYQRRFTTTAYPGLPPWPVTLVQVKDRPGGRRAGRSDCQQYPVFRDQAGGEFLVRPDRPPVLLPDGAETVQLGPNVLADLHRAGELDVAVAGRVVDEQLDTRVPGEDLVLRPGPGRRDVELRAVPEEPVRAQVRPAVLADARDDGIARFGQERVKRGSCHDRTITGAAWPAAAGPPIPSI
jgi:transcriptional regulator GlxA family with amidase domain